jgi:hypothetical protein
MLSNFHELGSQRATTTTEHERLPSARVTMQLRTEIQIESTPERVWRALTDFPAYSKWNPFITQIAGELVVGEQLRITLSLPEGSDMRFKPKLIRCEPARELRWRGRLLSGGLFAGEHFFQLHETVEGGTRFVHGEDFSGVLVKFMGQTLTRTARGFVYMNQALKRYVEEDRSASR